MAELNGNLDQKQAEQALSPDERRIFSHVFSSADSDNLGVITGDVALRFFPEKTRLPSETLGEIWQIADADDKGFVTPAGFYVVLRLIGYAQAGRTIASELVSRPGPLPRLEGIQLPSSPIQAQNSGGPIPIPRLLPEKAQQYATLFEQSGAQDGALNGTVAKQIFDRAQLPNDILIRIWNLADTEQRGKLSVTEFIIAMHLLASFRSGAMRALPINLPAGLYEAAARRGAPARPGSRPTSEFPPPPAISRQFSGGSGVPRTSSPLTRQPYNAPALSAQTTGATSDWAIPPQEKAQYDAQFARLDTNKQGSIGGETAVTFFSNSKLSENDLAHIWDLADITQTGSLTQDEFAVALHLIRQQLNKRGPLPAALPPNLIPPSLRQQTQAPAQIPPSPPKPKSAADDLFGLDALTAPAAAQIPQSTGGSSAVAPSSSAASPSPQQPSTHFKPFVPTSSFGQSIVSPQPTGAPGGTTPTPQNRSIVDDDLLGDADPEVNEKFTQETTDLGNLSNQVNNLTTQVKDVQNKQTISSQEQAQLISQKRDLETRLTQLRAAYEQEARNLKASQDQVTISKTDLAKLQQDFAMVQHTYQQQREQKQQVQTTLEATQNEIATLREKLAQLSREINQIKPQIEKMQSDLRQQKGLVTINKKQLSTAEAERDKAKAELENLSKEYDTATEELTQSTRSLEAIQTENSRAEAKRTMSPPQGIASPAPSTSSMNPFFRRTTSVSSNQPAVQSPLAPQPLASPNHSAFDSFFGDTFARAEEQDKDVPEDAVPDPEIEATSTPLQPGSPFTEPLFPSATQLPPPPPQSRQMTPSSLPLRGVAPRAPSSTSSIGVIPPASQVGDLSEMNTPTKDRGLTTFDDEPQALSSSSLYSEEARKAPVEESSEDHEPNPVSAGSFAPAIPGAFPTSETPEPTPAANAPSAGFEILGHKEVSDGQPKDGSSSSKNAFDALFGSFGSSESKGKAPVSNEAFGSSKPATESEFPPIQEFGDEEDESDSESELSHGFQDNFAPSPPHFTTGSVVAATESLPPTLSRGVSNTSQLPTPNAQKSPPSYGEIVSPPGNAPEHRDSNQFPLEFSGLLPARSDPTTSLNPQSQANGTTSTSDIQTTSVTAVDHPPSISPQPQAQPSQFLHPSQPALPTNTQSNLKSNTSTDDFESAFDDLTEAQVAEEGVDDELFSHRDTDGFEDFNPTFDSPAPSKAPTLESSAFQDFENCFAPSQGQSMTQSAISGAPSRPGPTKDEWDAMFAGLGSVDEAADAKGPANGTGSGVANTATGKSKDFLDVFSIPGSGTSATGATNELQKPALSRTVSTEHDDPILKHLTGMGYSRDASVKALEKYDYNLDKAADYLASQS